MDRSWVQSDVAKGPAYALARLCPSFGPPNVAVVPCTAETVVTLPVNATSIRSRNANACVARNDTYLWRDTLILKP